jgi:hypothetical protein
LPLLRARSDQRDSCAEEGDDGKRDVDVQTEAPLSILRQNAAEDEPHRSAATRDGAVKCKRLGALFRLREAYRQERQRGRREQRTEGALQRSRTDEDREAPRRAAE